MRTSLNVKILRFVAAVALGSASTGAHAIDFFLVAGAGTKVMPDGAAVPVWGFGLEADADFTVVDAVPAVPGPALVVPPGETTVNVTVLNQLSVPISLVVPGLLTTAPPTPTWVDAAGAVTAAGSPFRPPGDETSRVRSLAAETPPGGTRTYSFVAAPGSHLYQSGTDPSVHVRMGLYGSLRQDAGPATAYPGATYAREITLVLGELDPAFNAAIASSAYASGTSGLATSSGARILDYAPKYFLVNGESAPSPELTFAVGAGEQVLLRFLNAGLEARVPLLLGGAMRVVAEDGAPYAHARAHHAPLLAAGKTLDAFVELTPGTYPIFDRRMGLTTGVPSPSWNASRGGMLLQLVSAAPEP
jgi:FtsP/CotA-like multicopper oxidase with cupredoxin domain